MPKDNPRSRRIGEQLRQELADILWREMKDPRVHGVTLTAVEVTPDLDFAKIWFTLMQADEAKLAEALKVLKQAAGFLRTQLAHRMRLRTVPKLTFIYDESVLRAAHLTDLIDKAVEEDKRHHQDD